MNPTSSLRWIAADLHIHTVLSACAEVEMIPPLILRRALELGLDLIAITDHNTSKNCLAMIRAAAGTGLIVLPGMEVQTVEDLHVVCLFDDLERALDWQDSVSQHLPARRNVEDVLGAQYVVDAAGDYLSTDERLLATSTDLSLEEVMACVLALGGLPIPAHIDRPAFGLIPSLGFVPPQLADTPMELFRLTNEATFRNEHPELHRTPLIRSSDAHRLSEIVPTVRLRVSEPSIVELTRAFSRVEGRDYIILAA